MNSASFAESWDCSCNKIMADKCNTKDLTSMMFIACYRSSCKPHFKIPEEHALHCRTQLCKNPKVCQNWKEEVCCKDNDKALVEGLKKELHTLSQNMNTEQFKALKIELNEDCAARHGDCKHEHIGPIVKMNCPTVCGLCQLRTLDAQPLIFWCLHRSACRRLLLLAAAGGSLLFLQLASVRPLKKTCSTSMMPSQVGCQLSVACTFLLLHAVPVACKCMVCTELMSVFK